MKIVVLDGYAGNPGDLSWDELRKLGDLTIYDRTPSDRKTILERIGDAELVFTNKTPLSAAIFAACPSLKFVGILATGYNGVPTGLAHCSETGCLRQQLGVPSGQRHEICRGLHAEQNAIIQAAKYGIDISGSSIYVNTQPCVVCAKMLINAGITEVVFQNPYPDELACEMLREAGVSLREYQG